MIDQRSIVEEDGPDWEEGCGCGGGGEDFPLLWLNRLIKSCKSLSHAPICKNNLMFFEEHCVIFYAKFVIDDPVWSRIINVIQNILFINK